MGPARVFLPLLLATVSHADGRAPDALERAAAREAARERHEDWKDQREAQREQARERAEAREKAREEERRASPFQGDIRRFDEDDLETWRRGRWEEGVEGGDPAWWWVVGPIWYPYPDAVAPYPDPYVPPGMEAPPEGTRWWYVCDDPSGYYPYVPMCDGPWRAVEPGD
jgi:hypothetical protein